MNPASPGDSINRSFLISLSKERDRWPVESIILDTLFAQADGALVGPLVTVNATATVASHLLTVTPSGSDGTVPALIKYPTSPGRDGRATWKLKGTGSGTSVNSHTCAAFRWNGSIGGAFSGYYAVAGFGEGTNGRFDIWSLTGGNFNNVTAVAFTSAPVQTNDIIIQVECFGVNPTTFVFSVVDHSSGVTYCSGTANEATSTITSTTGFIGFGLEVLNGPTTSVLSELTVESGALGITSLWPDLANPPTATTVHLLGVMSGGASPLSTVLDRSIDGGTTWVTGINTGTSPNLVYTDTPGVTGPANVFYRWTVTDSTTPTPAVASTICLARVPAVPVLVSFIGDSTTYQNCVTQYMAAAVNSVCPDRAITVINEGVSGSTSSQWVDGSVNLVTAITDPLAVGCKIASVSLGINSSKDFPGNIAETPASYGADIASMIVGLKRAGYTRIILNDPLTPVGPVPTTTYWDGKSVVVVTQYSAQLDALCDGVTVFKGDREAHGYIANHAGDPTVTFEGIHPQSTPAGGFVIAGMWTTAIVAAMGWVGQPTVTSSGGGGGGGGVGTYTITATAKNALRVAMADLPAANQIIAAIQSAGASAPSPAALQVLRSMLDK